MTSESQRDAAGEGSGSAGYLALVLAWAIPGLGHFLLGQWARAIVFAVTIHGLFALGMLIAGVRAINPPDQAIWTYTQFLTGWPMIVANQVEKRKAVEIAKLQTEYEQHRPGPEDENDPVARQAREAYGKAFIEEHPLFANHPKVQDIGAVYCGIAGMLNLLVMFDVLLRITGSERETQDKKKRAGGQKKEAEVTPTAGGV